MIRDDRTKLHKLFDFVFFGALPFAIFLTMVWLTRIATGQERTEDWPLSFASFIVLYALWSLRAMERQIKRILELLGDRNDQR